MIRNITTLALALFAIAPAVAQTTFTWNGPFTGTSNWSPNFFWSPTTPPTGGGANFTLNFQQIGSGSYNAVNNLGNPFQLNNLNFNSYGGGISISSLAGNSLAFPTAPNFSINQNGIGWGTLNSPVTLGGGIAVIGGTNFGNFSINNPVSGGNPLVINRPQNQFTTGLFDLATPNPGFSGPINLADGNLRVGDSNALGTGGLTSQGGTLGAAFSGLNIPNTIALSSDLVFSGFNDLTLSGVINAAGTNRGVVLSTIGAQTLTLQGNNNYTGPTTAVINPRLASSTLGAGSLTLSGASGSANLSSEFTFRGGGTLTLDNSGASNSNRIGELTPVTISGGAFVLIGATGGATTEKVGTFDGGGSVRVTVDAGASGNTGTTFWAEALGRAGARGQFDFRGNNASFGGAPGSNVANVIFNAAPSLVGGGGAAGTTAISVIPYAVGGTTTSGSAASLVTYGANGIRPLAANEYATTITNGSSTQNNVRLGTTQPITSPTQINALVVDTNGSFAGSNSTLTVASGAVINTSGGGFTIPAAMTLAFGAAEGVAFLNAGMTVDGNMTGTNGLTKAGAGTLTLNNSVNAVSGQLTLNDGLVQFSSSAALNSFDVIAVNGRSSTSTAGLRFDGAGTAIVPKAMLVADGFARLESSGGILLYTGSIGGTGGVLISGGNVELQHPGSLYSGQTRVIGGTLRVGSDTALGSSGSGVDFGGGGLFLTNNWTTSRPISFSSGSDVLIDTNGFNWTVNSPLTGTNAKIDKANPGIWTLTQGGSLGQSLFSGTALTTSTVNIFNGELRVTNTTGSATGTAAVNINSQGILSGHSTNSGIAGVTTIGSTASLRPGLGGTTVGTLNFRSNLIINGTYNLDGETTTADQVNALGIVTLGPSSVLNLSGAFNPATTFTLLTGDSISGLFGAVNGLPASHNLIYNSFNVQLVPVPEPIGILAVAGLGLAIGHRVRKSRARSKRF